MASAAAAAESALNASQSREAELEAELNASRAAEARSERAKDALDWKLRKTTAIMDAFESLLPGADNASATPNASNVSEPMTNASDTSFLNSTAPSSDAACKSSCDMSGTWVDGTGAEIGLVTDAANPCAGAHAGGAWTYTVTESASGTTITLSDGTVGTIGGSAPARTITWSNGITYTEQSDSTISSCPSSCDVGGTWVDGTGAKIGMATDAANPCAGAEESGAWTYTVKVSAEGKKVTLSDGTVGTVEGSAPARTITWSNGITYTEETTESAPEQCKNRCDMSGTWVDGSGTAVGLVTDAANRCAGAHDGGAWSYTVTESASGTTITLSDGTVGTVGGSAPERVITFSNGITYTE